MDSLVSVEDALEVVRSSAPSLGRERCALEDAVGRTLAVAVTGGPLPPFDTSAMDGLAVRLSDLGAMPARLPVAGVIHAGDRPAGALEAGTAVAVMTGAPIPVGTEAIVPVEWTRRDGDAAVIERAPSPGQFLRPAGSALPDGALVLEAGDTVTPGAVGLLASVGAVALEVVCRPTVAVVSTGDEVVPAGASPGPGQIRNANGPGLAAQAAAAGAHVLEAHALDDPASVRDTLEAASGADVLVFAGGVSMGERDLVRPELERRGVDWRFWGVRQRPGKPLAAGVLEGVAVFGLPGNPVSAAVCFEVYVRALLDASLGRTPRPLEVGVLEDEVPKATGLHTFARVTASSADRVRLSPAGDQASHAALSLAVSDGLAHLPAEWDAAPAGVEVAFQRWPWR